MTEVYDGHGPSHDCQEIQTWKYIFWL